MCNQRSAGAFYLTTITLIMSSCNFVLQVKKFASINLDDEKKKPQKRSASPKSKPMLMKNPIAIAPYVNSNSYTPPMKKMKVRISTYTYLFNMQLSKRIFKFLVCHTQLFTIKIILEYLLLIYESGFISD